MRVIYLMLSVFILLSCGSNNSTHNSASNDSASQNSSASPKNKTALKNEDILNNETAKNLIIDSYNLPRTETRQFTKGYMTTEAYGNRHRPLIDAGYLSLRTGSNLGDWLEYTEKLKPFIAKPCDHPLNCYFGVRIGVLNFKEIKGLRKINESEYEVLYSLQRELNEFGQILNGMPKSYLGESLSSEPFANLTCTLVKYNTGWQIQQTDIDNFKKTFEANLRSFAIKFAS